MGPFDKNWSPKSKRLRIKYYHIWGWIIQIWKISMEIVGRKTLTGLQQPKICRKSALKLVKNKIYPVS